MPATLQKPAGPKSRPLSKKLPKGTPVRVIDREGAYYISSPAEWGGHDYSKVTHYHLVALRGGLVPGVSAAKISALSPEALAEALIHAETEEPSPPAMSGTLRRMLEDPETILKMAARLLGTSTVDCRNLRAIAERLLPFYRSTHCGCCHESLDNFTGVKCQKCGWIACSCGGCGCNWPGRSQSFT
jgi:hypothetical protein